MFGDNKETEKDRWRENKKKIQFFFRSDRLIVIEYAFDTYCIIDNMQFNDYFFFNFRVGNKIPYICCEY